MKPRWTLFAACCAAVLAGPAHADEAAVAVVKKAIEAHGGAEALDKYKASRVEGSGTISMMGQEFEFEVSSVAMRPGKLKNTITMNVMGTGFTVNQILDGENVLMQANGMEIPASDAQVKEMKLNAETQDLYNITGLLEDKYALKKLADAEFAGKAAEVVEVNRDGWDSPIKFYFGKEGHMLLGAERKGLDPTEQEADLRQVLADYKKVQGTMQPGGVTVYSDGQKFMTMKFEKIELLEKVDAKEFSAGDD